MPRKKLDPLPADVIGLRQRFEHWRATRGKICRIPREFMEEAAHLARLHGINPVSRALRLNHSALRDWAGRKGRKKNAITLSSRPSFVQVAPLTALPPPCFQVEVESPGGVKMVIRIPGAAMAEAVALVDSLFRAKL